MAAGHEEGKDTAWASLQRDNPQLPAWLHASAEALAKAPDPQAARALAEGVLLAAGRTALQSKTAQRPERLCRILWALCGVAPFLGVRLRCRPDWLWDLLDDELERARTLRELRASLAAALAEGEEPAVALRRFKYYELARLTVRDCNHDLVPLPRSGLILSELSQLADVLLDSALSVARSQIEARYGPARWRSQHTQDQAAQDVALSFAVLGLGKLGSQELNYSSDVDLVYVFELPVAELDHAHVAAGYAALPPAEYFTRVAQRLDALVTATSDEGFLYRIDLDLRPEGSHGPLVVSHEALASYYEVRADTWEKASFMKARPVAGDLEFGWRAIRMVDPMIYRSSMDYDAVEGIRALKQKIEEARGGGSDAFDVKIDSGGIRDIEFVAQAMQLLHGGRIEQVRARGTQDSLERLRDVHLLPEQAVRELLEAYLFLRRLENRLQMHDERQVHRLATNAEAMARAARAMGWPEDAGPEAFGQVLAQHRERVLHVFESFFFEAGADRIFELFARHVPNLLAIQSSRSMLEELASEFARSIDASSDPQRALNNLDRFVDAIGGGRFYFELLLDRPELVPRLSALFASSNYLSSILATHPGLIEPVFHDPTLLLLEREQLERDFADILAQVRAQEDDDEAMLNSLRLFYYRQILNVGLLDLAGKVERRAVEASLTEIAEVCLSQALGSARQWLSRRRPALAEIGARTQFIVVGMGKLASGELSYGSDLDLIFLFHVPDAGDDAVAVVEAQEYATRLAQRLISMLQTNTAQGMCYEVDARLRPSGNQGTLVSSLSAFERYHARDAETWERQILLRARPSCGDAQLSEQFEQLRLQILRRPAPADMRQHIHHIRKRMEEELAVETASRRDFKRGRGGLLDVENIVQLRQLELGAERPELLSPSPLPQVLERLSALAALPAAQADELLEGWNFLQRLSSRLRVVENRSISDLDDERGDLESLARVLGYGGSGERDARRHLLADYERHTTRIRAIYRDVFEPE